MTAPNVGFTSTIPAPHGCFVTVVSLYDDNPAIDRIEHIPIVAFAAVTAVETAATLGELDRTGRLTTTPDGRIVEESQLDPDGLYLVTGSDFVALVLDEDVGLIPVGESRGRVAGYWSTDAGRQRTAIVAVGMVADHQRTRP